MTGLEVATTILLILSYVVIFATGLVVGGYLMAWYIARQMNEAQRAIERKLTAMSSLAPPKGDEWKPNDKDESWLRKILGEDKNKDVK